MATMTMKQFKTKIEKYKKRIPDFVYVALKDGSYVLIKEMKKQYRRKLRRSRGDIFDNIKRTTLKKTGGIINAAVGVADRYGTGLAAMHETGLPGRMTKSGRRNPLPKRSFVEPTKKAKLKKVQIMILKKMKLGWDHVKA